MQPRISANIVPGASPAARSCLDVAIWFLVRAANERRQLPMQKLQLLLYLAQNAYEARNGGGLLMPAAFVAGEQGPSEPNVALALECGLAAPPEPQIDAGAEPVLAAIWRQYAALPAEALLRVVRNAAAKASPPPVPDTSAPEDGAGEGAPKPRTHRDLRFTGDGRLVTRWMPRRRLQRKTS